MQGRGRGWGSSTGVIEKKKRIRSRLPEQPARPISLFFFFFFEDPSSHSERLSYVSAEWCLAALTGPGGHLYSSSNSSSNSSSSSSSSSSGPLGTWCALPLTGRFLPPGSEPPLPRWGSNRTAAALAGLPRVGPTGSPLAAGKLARRGRASDAFHETGTASLPGLPTSEAPGERRLFELVHLSALVFFSNFQACAESWVVFIFSFYSFFVRRSGHARGEK